jgi:hypothetical protein
MQFYGICRDFPLFLTTSTGILRVKLLSVALNIAVNSSAPSDDTQQPPGALASAPVTPVKCRKFSPSPPTSVAPGTAAPMPVSTTVQPPSNMPVPPALHIAPPGPMLYGHPFQHYLHMSAATNPFMAPFLPSLPYSMAGHPMFPQPGFSANAHFNSCGEYTSPTAIDTRVLNSSADSSFSSGTEGAGCFNDEESAFNKSAANPYSYPMTQMRVLSTLILIHLVLSDFIVPQITSQRQSRCPFDTYHPDLIICRPATLPKAANKPSTSVTSTETASGLQSASQELTSSLTTAAGPSSGAAASGAPGHNLGSHVLSAGAKQRIILLPIIISNICAPQSLNTIQMFQNSGRFDKILYNFIQFGTGCDP